MSKKFSVSMAWTILIFSLGCGLAAFFLFILNVDTVLPASWGTTGGARNNPADWLNVIVQGIFLPIFSCGFGILVIKKQPHNLIGWLLAMIGLGGAFSMLTAEWAVYANFTVGGGPPLGGLAAWFTNWIWVIAFSVSMLMLAIFPNGQYLTGRWRLLAGLPLALFFAVMLTAAMIETPMSSAYQIDNPFVQTPPEMLYDVLFVLGVLMNPLAVLMILFQFVLRFQSSTGRERQQLKWGLAGVALFVTLVLVGLFLVFILGIDYGGVLVNVSIIAPLTGIGVAMVRHQLYDIDVIIRRTLVYATLSGTLILIYFGVVIFLQMVLDTFVETDNSQLVVVVSTLLIAGLFRPLRLRIQRLIDRRFYRRKYDATQTLARFAVFARDEVNLQVLTQELLQVVEETMHPEEVSVWLKRPE